MKPWPPPPQTPGRGPDGFAAGASRSTCRVCTAFLSVPHEVQHPRKTCPKTCWRGCAYLAAMELHYGCFDLVATAAGILGYECNPFGQYGWLEDALDLPITSALADLLESGARR